MPISAGRVLARVTAAPVCVLSAWLLVCFPLLVLGSFTPAAAGVVGLPAALAAAVWLPRLAADVDAPWWSVAGVVVVAVGFAAVQVAHRAEEFVVRRDAGSLAQYTVWIAHEGSLPVSQQRELLAGDEPGLGYGGLAFYEVGTEIWPQFLAGAPLVYAPGYWVAGLDGLVVVPPILGALGVLTFAGLTARLVGAGWAPAAALLLAVCLPQQWVARATYSEPLAQVLILGALLLAHDALAGAREGGRRAAMQTLAAASGLAFGLSMVARIDALRDVLPVVVFVGLLTVARHGAALPLLLGLLCGAAWGFTASFGLSRPYVQYLWDSMLPLLVLASAVVALTVAAVAALRRRGLRPAGSLTAFVAAGAAVAGIFLLALRPWLHVERGHGIQATADWVGWLQREQGLAVDPDRTYAEMSLHWVAWYASQAAVVLAAIGVALLVHRALRGRAPAWVLPLMVLLWSSAATLLRPAITPDHPWAARRLVVLVLPAVILLAVWAVAWAAARHRGRSPRQGRALIGGLLAGSCLAAMLVPATAAASGIMGHRADAGSAAEVRRLCNALPERASVVITDAATAGGYAQLVRGMCRVPTAYLRYEDQEMFAAVASEIRARDRTPVLLGAAQERFWPLLPGDVGPEPVFHLDTVQSPSTLTEPPRGTRPYTATLYLVIDPETDPR